MCFCWPLTRFVFDNIWSIRPGNTLLRCRRQWTDSPDITGVWLAVQVWTVTMTQVGPVTVKLSETQNAETFRDHRPTPRHCRSQFSTVKGTDDELQFNCFKCCNISENLGVGCLSPDSIYVWFICIWVCIYVYEFLKWHCISVILNLNPHHLQNVLTCRFICRLCVRTTLRTSHWGFLWQSQSAARLNVVSGTQLDHLIILVLLCFSLLQDLIKLCFSIRLDSTCYKSLWSSSPFSS